MAYIGQKPANKPVEGSDISSTVITGQTALSTAPADTDEFLISDAGTLKRIDASLVVGGGKVNQVIQTVKTDTFSSASGTLTDITGMSAVITPTASDSKVLVMVNMNVSVSMANRWANFQLLRGSTAISLGDASGSRTRGSFFMALITGSGELNDIEHKSLCFLDSPSTTSATTYKMQGMVQTDSSPSFLVNRSSNDADASYGGRPASSITLMEILA